jgi:hypothetical protein
MDQLKSWLVPVAGLALAGFLVIYVVKDLMAGRQTPPCSASYPPATQFSLLTDKGALLTPAELQARAGSTDWGVLERTKVIAVKGAPTAAVIQVMLPKGGASPFQTKDKSGGMSFHWSPDGLAEAQAACLSYHVYVPAGFDFGDGGELPGLYGGPEFKPGEKLEAGDSISARLRWGNDGEGEFRIHEPDALSGGLARAMSAENFTLPRERWVLVQQEVVLNTPGVADGLARLWIDGSLKAEREKITWRDKDTVKMTGVTNDVWFGGANSRATAPIDAYIAISPATVSWK